MLEVLSTCLFYFLSTVLQGMRNLKKTGSSFLIKGCILIGIFFHFLTIWHTLHQSNGLNFSAVNVISLTSLLIILFVWLINLKKLADSLFLLILPFSIISILASYYSKKIYILDTTSFMILSHVLLSILAYGILCIATFQSLLISYQERQFKNHKARRLFYMPPLQTMEILLFDFINLGILLLTASLLSGFFYIEKIFSDHMFNKTIFSILSWIIFTTLLFGRKFYGWRGQTPVKWALSGFVCLIFGYYGCHFLINAPT